MVAFSKTVKRHADHIGIGLLQIFVKSDDGFFIPALR